MATKPQTRQQQSSNGHAEHDAGDQWLIAQREGKRRIKLSQQQEKAKSKTEAVVLTNAGLPDMRFAEDKMLFSPDPSQTLEGKPDRRFLNNREDLLEVHRKRGETRKNFIFTDDMVPENA